MAFLVNKRDKLFIFISFALATLIGLSAGLGLLKFLLILFAFIVALFLFAKPWLALMLMVLMAQMEANFPSPLASVASIEIRWLDIVLVLILFSWFTKGAIKKDLKIYSEPIHLSVIFFFLVGFTSLFIASFLFPSNSFLAGVISFGKYWEYFLIYFLILNLIRNTTQIRKIVSFLVFLSFIQALLALEQYFSFRLGYSLPYPLSSPFGVTEGSIRVAGLLGNPADLVYYSMFLILISLSLIPERKNISSRFFLVFNIILLLVASTLSFSRGPLITTVVVLLFYASTQPKKRKAFIPSFLIVAMGVSLNQAFRARVLSIFTEFLTGTGSLASRAKMWSLHFELIRKFPVLGVGWMESGFARIFIPTALRENVTGRGGLPVETTFQISGNAHNQYIQIASETGFIGLLTFIFFLVFILGYLWQNYRKVRDLYFKRFYFALFFGFLGLDIAFCFDTVFFGGSTTLALFWLLLGLAVASKKALISEDKFSV